MPSHRRQLNEARAALDEARDYPSWLRAAEAVDARTGGDAWRDDDRDVGGLDRARLRSDLLAIRAAREARQGELLAGLLSDSLYRHLADLASPGLYAGALAGPKRFVDEYLDEAESALLWLADTSAEAVPDAVKLARFEVAWRVFGRTALLLSGGATLGFHHLGVVKGLFDQGLLPDILSGASTGAMIAAGACARDDTELQAMYDNLDSLRLDGLAPVGVRAALSARAWLDPNRLEEVLRNNVGDLTFAEAHARSGRTLNISVSPARPAQKPRLLTHLTAPDVLVASAALASSALPGLFPPVVLRARGADGVVVDHVPGERWVDGSLRGDVPKLRLARLHNVNHFIVSQTNPHVLPFVTHHDRRGLASALAEITSSAVRNSSVVGADVARRATRSTRGVARLAEATHALVAQDYGGDIDIHPRFHLALYRKIVSNPTRADLDAFVLEGQRSVWPKVALIRNQTRIGRAFRRAIEILRRRISGARTTGR